MDTRTRNTIIKELIATTQIHYFLICCYLPAFWIRLADTNQRWTDSLLVNQVGWVFGWAYLFNVKTIYHLKHLLYMDIFNSPLMCLIPNKKEDIAAYHALGTTFGCESDLPPVLDQMVYSSSASAISSWCNYKKRLSPQRAFFFSHLSTAHVASRSS